MIETTKVYAFSIIHFSDLFNYGSFLSQVGKQGPLLLRKPSVCFVFECRFFPLHNNLLKRSLYAQGSLNQLPIAYLKGFKNAYCIRESVGQA